MKGLWALATAVVFARGGSKGLPGKNLLEIAGTPLVGRAVEIAKATPGISRVMCSTDSAEIAAVALSFGAEIPFIRPARLAHDTSPELDSWKHFAQHLRSGGFGRDEIIVSLPATAPLRDVKDVTAALQKMDERSADLIVTYSESTSNPWFNMIQIHENHQVELVIPALHSSVSQRQAAPAVYNLVPVAYVTSIGYILATQALLNGVVEGVSVPRERSIDIDSELDYRIAKMLGED